MTYLLILERLRRLEQVVFQHRRLARPTTEGLLVVASPLPGRPCLRNPSPVSWLAPALFCPRQRGPLQRSGGRATDSLTTNTSSIAASPAFFFRSCSPGTRPLLPASSLVFFSSTRAATSALPDTGTPKGQKKKKRSDTGSALTFCRVRLLGIVNQFILPTSRAHHVGPGIRLQRARRLEFLTGWHTSQYRLPAVTPEPAQQAVARTPCGVPLPAARLHAPAATGRIPSAHLQPQPDEQRA